MLRVRYASYNMTRTSKGIRSSYEWTTHFIAHPGECLLWVFSKNEHVINVTVEATKQHAVVRADQALENIHFFGWVGGDGVKLFMILNMLFLSFNMIQKADTICSISNVNSLNFILHISKVHTHILHIMGIVSVLAEKPSFTISHYIFMGPVYADMALGQKLSLYVLNFLYENISKIFVMSWYRRL